MLDLTPDITVLDAATALAHAPLELLLARALQSRRDWKFPVPASVLPAVLKRLAPTHGVVLSAGHPVARYVTDYLDTPDLRCFHDHRRGRTVRYKVRYRDYRERQLTRLEVKVRDPRMGTQKHFLVRPFGDHRLTREDADFLAAHCPFDVGTLVQTLRVEYFRTTLVAFDREERLTIDHGLAWSPRGFSGTGRHCALPGVGVIEVKSACRRSAAPTLAMLAELGFRPSGVSKYCTGLSRTRPELRNNALLPTLRRLQRLASRT